MNILDLLAGDGFKPKYVGRVKGFKEYHGPCPRCGGKDRFVVTPDKAETGWFWCRDTGHGCGWHGDGIQYLRDCRGMSYEVACRYLRVEPKKYSQQSTPMSIKKDNIWSPKKENDLPCELYQNRAKAFIEKSIRNLWSPVGTEKLTYLKQRTSPGRCLNEKTIKKARIGYNPVYDRSETRGAWGIEIDTGTPIHLSRGITIPYFTEDGKKIARVRFRLDEPIIRKTKEGKKEERYVILAGSNTQPMICNEQHIITMIVESELCGWLLYQEAGDLINIVALGNAQKKPDKATDSMLKKSDFILFALDYDDAGITQFPWWENQYKNIKYWPPAVGKDPTEAFQQGLDLRDWIKASFPWPEDIFELYEERAAIMQHDGGLSRENAERNAFQYVMNQLEG